MSKVIPVSNHLIVKPLDAQSVSKGGIHIPDVAKEKPQKGKVVAVGPGRFSEQLSAQFRDERYEPMCCSEGDVVLFARYHGSEIDIDGESFLVLTDGDVLAVIK